MNTVTVIFSDREARLEDARAAAQEAIERQLVNAAAREANLIDFLAAGFAEAERRYRGLSLDDKIAALIRLRNQTPEEYGQDMAPWFLDILKELAGVKPGQGLRPELLGRQSELCILNEQDFILF